MDWATWAAVALFATLLSGATLLTDLDEVIWALPAALAWVIVGLGATNLERLTETGTVVQFEYVSVALYAGGMAVVMLIVLLRGAAVALHPDDAVAEGFPDDPDSQRR